MNTPNAEPTTPGQGFGDKLTELRALLGDIAKAAPGAASDAFDELKNKAKALCDCHPETGEGCEAKPCAMTRTVVKVVKEHPAQVALVAVSAGLLAWWLLTRGRKAD